MGTESLYCQLEVQIHQTELLQETPPKAKRELEIIKESLEKQIGFSVSLSDTIRHLIKLHNGKVK